MITLLQHEKNKLLIIAGLVSTLFFLQYFQSTLIFDQEKIGNGEYWRLVTGNFVHINHLHIVMNLTGTLILLTLFKEQINKLELIIFFTVSATFIGFCLYFFSPDIHRYAGFSGILYGSFLYIASLSIYQKNYHYALPVIMLVCGKTLYEILRTPSASNETLLNIPVAIDAHLYGLLCGFVYFLTLVLLKKHA
jgi:rhomboid family GlyGly-CTERM serine protease